MLWLVQVLQKICIPVALEVNISIGHLDDAVMTTKQIQYCIQYIFFCACATDTNLQNKDCSEMHSNSCSRIGIAEVMGSNPAVEASEFFLGFLCNCYFITARITFTIIISLLNKHNSEDSKVSPSKTRQEHWSNVLLEQLNVIKGMFIFVLQRTFTGSKERERGSGANAKH